MADKTGEYPKSLLEAIVKGTAQVATPRGVLSEEEEKSFNLQNPKPRIGRQTINDALSYLDRPGNEAGTLKSPPHSPKIERKHTKFVPDRSSLLRFVKEQRLTTGDANESNITRLSRSGQIPGMAVSAGSRRNPKGS